MEALPSGLTIGPLSPEKWMLQAKSPRRYLAALSMVAKRQFLRSINLVECAENPFISILLNDGQISINGHGTEVSSFVVLHPQHQLVDHAA